MLGALAMAGSKRVHEGRVALVTGAAYDKPDDHVLASVQLASIRIWLRHDEAVSSTGFRLATRRYSHRVIQLHNLCDRIKRDQ